MIKIIIGVSILISLVFSGLVYVNKANCWDCDPNRCSFDLDCESYCWCYKEEFELDGYCVTE